MKKSKSVAALLVLCTLTLLGTSTATYAENQFGISGGYNFKRESSMIGARYVIPVNPKFKIVPALALDFEIDEIVLDVDAHIINSGSSFYFLAGLNYANDDAGLNLGAGLQVDFTQKTKGFLELKYVSLGWDGMIF